MPGLLFTLQQDVSKIGILINKLYNVLFQFFISKDFLLFDDVFLLQAKKIKV